MRPHPRAAPAAAARGTRRRSRRRSPGTPQLPPPPRPRPLKLRPHAAAPPAAAPAAPAAPAERVEVALDQAVFDEKLAELLEKGTDRRVAEGQARRAAMIAARKKAEGG